MNRSSDDRCFYGSRSSDLFDEFVGCSERFLVEQKTIASAMTRSASAMEHCAHTCSIQSIVCINRRLFDNFIDNFANVISLHIHPKRSDRLGESVLTRARRLPDGLHGKNGR